MKNVLFPDMYAKDIFSINYDKLKKNKIKTLVFDLDNTIVEPGHKIINPDTKKLFERLKKDFNCIVLSNTVKYSSIKNFCSELGTEFVWLALKPSLIGFKRAKKLHNSNSNEICMIGDQYFTDVKGAKKMGYFTILIDPIGPRENVFVKINRVRENKKYQSIKFEKGHYYD